MSRRRFLSATFEFKTPPSEKRVESKLNLAIDWVKFAPNSWLLWTSSDPDKWNSRFKTFMKSGDRVFVCEVDVSERSGVMPRSFWDFIKSHQADIG